MVLFLLAGELNRNLIWKSMKINFFIRQTDGQQKKGTKRPTESNWAIAFATAFHEQKTRVSRYRNTAHTHTHRLNDKIVHEIAVCLCCFWLLLIPFAIVQGHDLLTHSFTFSSIQ